MQEVCGSKHWESDMTHMRLSKFQQNVLMKVTKARCLTAGSGHKNLYFIGMSQMSINDTFQATFLAYKQMFGATNQFR